MNGSVHGAIMAIISWADGVISVAEPLIVLESSVSGILAGSGLLLPVSPSHATDGLKSLSRNMLGGGDPVAFCADAGEDIRRLIVFPSHMMKFEPLEPS